MNRNIFSRVLGLNHFHFNLLFAAIQFVLWTLYYSFFHNIAAVNLKILLSGLILIFAVQIIFWFMTKFLLFKPIYKVYTIIHNLRFNISHPKFLESDPDLCNFKNFNLKVISEEINFYVSQKEEEIKMLRHLETYRKDLIANISHELKTPIFSAQGYIATLLNHQPTDKKTQTNFLKKAIKSLNLLDFLVRDLITLSRLESGEISLNREIFDIQTHVLETFEDLRKKARKKRISLKIKTFSEAGVYVLADQSKINQVLSNLISNAINYGREGGFVEVDFQVKARQVEIKIRDNGIGIAPEHLGYIFRRFYRIDKSRSKRQSGTGLGLAIVKHILELHNCKIDVISKIEKGSTFSFSLNRDV